jgi:predicted nuclease of restriction endonuclease-like (RecB) superfamily
MSFDSLVAQVARAHAVAERLAGQSLDRLLCVRNWIIGSHIVHFEQGGVERAGYGDLLIEKLASTLQARGCAGMSTRNLRNFRQLALAYPLLDSGAMVQELGPGAVEIWQTSAKSQVTTKRQTSAESSHAPLEWRDAAWVARLFGELSFSHLLELARIQDETERAFYELHCLKERWSVREMIRQRSSMLFQRVGLSERREEVLALARQGHVGHSPTSQLRDPYVLEFVGLRQTSIVRESDLENALVEHLSQFLLELGRDFCFVERQFRITVGNRHHHLDLLFFHRTLRCLVAVDLKLGEFVPDHAGQMRFYLNYLAKEVAKPGENPPIGILLCTEKDSEVVHFATAGDEGLFVSRYLLELPSAETLKRWLHEEKGQLLQSLATPDEGAEGPNADQ